MAAALRIAAPSDRPPPARLTCRRVWLGHQVDVTPMSQVARNRLGQRPNFPGEGPAQKVTNGPVAPGQVRSL